MTPEDQELLQSLATPLERGLLTVADDPTPVLVALSQAFPFEVNRLAWWLVPGAVEETTPRPAHGSRTCIDDARAFAEFLERIRIAHELTGTVAVLGDGFLEAVIRGDVVDIINHIPTIANFPQHTYVFPFPTVSWAAGLSMEGQMHFAYAPSAKNHEASNTPTHAPSLYGAFT